MNQTDRGQPADWLWIEFLPDSEREDALRHAKANPQSEPWLEASRRMREAVEEPGSLDTFLAWAHATPGLGPIAERLREPAASPAGAAAQSRVLDRLREADRALDARAHFERLYTAGGPRRPWWLVPASAAAVLALVFTVGYWSEAESARLAHRQIAERAAVRSGAADQAEQLARQARGRALGIWPAYDQQRLMEAESLLVLAGPSVENELLLARIRLMQGRMSEARTLLERLAQGESPASEDAAALLEAM